MLRIGSCSLIPARPEWTACRFVAIRRNVGLWIDGLIVPPDGRLSSRLVFQPRRCRIAALAGRLRCGRRCPFPCVRPSRLRTRAFDGRWRCDVLPSCPFDRRFGSGPLWLDWSGGADRRHSAVSRHHAHQANGAVPAVPVSRVPRADAEPAPGADEHPARRPDVASGPLQADAARREPAGGGAWLDHTELAGRPLRGRPAANPRLPRPPRTRRRRSTSTSSRRSRCPAGRPRARMRT